MKPYSKSTIGAAQQWLDDDRCSALEDDSDAGVKPDGPLSELFNDLRNDLPRWNRGSIVDWVPTARENGVLRLPPPHVDCLALNRDGRIFRARMCYGLHEPFFTMPHGDKDNPSDTIPKWIDVTHWAELPTLPDGHK